MRSLIRCAAPCALAIAAGCGPDVKAGDVPADVRSAFLGADSVLTAGVAPVAPSLDPGVVAYPAVLYSDLDADIGDRGDRSTREVDPAMLQACVAMAFTRTALRRRIFSAETFNAASARSMAASESRPLWPSPSPRRTIRE